MCYQVSDILLLSHCVQLTVVKTFFATNRQEKAMHDTTTLRKDEAYKMLLFL